jgi:hypothetical protein
VDGLSQTEDSEMASKYRQQSQNFVDVTSLLMQSSDVGSLDRTASGLQRRLVQSRHDTRVSAGYHKDSAVNLLNHASSRNSRMHQTFTNPQNIEVGVTELTKLELEIES